MKKIDENFYGYIRVEGDTYTYNVSDNIVTLLPAQSDPQKRDDSLYRIKSHKTDTPEYLFGEDNNSMIAILRNGKFVTDPIGTNVAIRFATPIIIKACGNATVYGSALHYFAKSVVGEKKNRMPGKVDKPTQNLAI